MRYLVTESQKENVIKKYILSNFDLVQDVWFTTRTVHYVSGPVNGKDRGEIITINVLVDNTSRKENLTKTELNKIKIDIINKTDKTFNLEYNRYGGGWDFSFLKKVIESF